MLNAMSHPYYLDESTFNFRGIRSNFSYLFHFAMKFMKTNRIAPDGMPHFVGSYLGQFCLPMSHKKDTRLIWVNVIALLLQCNTRRHHYLDGFGSGKSVLFATNSSSELYNCFNIFRNFAQSSHWADLSLCCLATHLF